MTKNKPQSSKTLAEMELPTFPANDTAAKKLKEWDLK
jgi:hypothetical protein